MDRRRDPNLLLLRAGTRCPGSPWQLQQVQQQRLQVSSYKHINIKNTLTFPLSLIQKGRPDRVHSEFLHEYTKRSRDILGRRLHGARATEARRRSSRIRYTHAELRNLCIFLCIVFFFLIYFHFDGVYTWE